jgi:4-hydroxy-2-oxoheptanedioate aldolase
MLANRVKQLYSAGKTAFGTYVVIPSPMVIEVAGQAGLDFVRIDNYHNRWNPETLANMIRSCYDQDITPWIRCRNDPWIIMTTLDMGAQALSISNIGTVEATRQAVASTFYPPKGEREMARAHRFRSMSGKEYLDWSANEVFLSVQVEGDEGIVNYREIVKVEGVDCIQTGRNDIASALGMVGQEYHPKVLELEDRIVDAAIEAGKQVALVYPATEEHLERVSSLIQRGVRILTVDHDYSAMRCFYTNALGRLRPIAEKQG